MIHEPTHPNWVAHDGTVKELFGLNRKAKWPTEGMPKRVIQGVTCWVDPIVPKGENGRRPFMLRASCFCPMCGTVMPIGRLSQHEGTKTCTRRMK